MLCCRSCAGPCTGTEAGGGCGAFPGWEKGCPGALGPPETARVPEGVQRTYASPDARAAQPFAENQRVALSRTLLLCTLSSGLDNWYLSKCRRNALRTKGSERLILSLSVQSCSEMAAAEAFRLANTLNSCMSNIIDMASKLYEHRRKMYQGYNPTVRVPCFCIASLVVGEDMERARM